MAGAGTDEVAREAVSHERYGTMWTNARLCEETSMMMQRNERGLIRLHRRCVEEMSTQVNEWSYSACATGTVPTALSAVRVAASPSAACLAVAVSVCVALCACTPADQAPASNATGRKTQAPTLRSRDTRHTGAFGEAAGARHVERITLTGVAAVVNGFDTTVDTLGNIAILTNVSLAWEARASNLVQYMSLLTPDERRHFANRLYWMKGADDTALLAYQLVAETERDAAQAQLARSFAARVMARTGKLEEAYNYLAAESEKHLQTLEGTYALVDYLGMLAALHGARAEYDQQVAYAKKAMESAQKLRDDRMRVREMRDRTVELAYAYANAGQYHEAMELFKHLAQDEVNPAYQQVWAAAYDDCQKVVEGRASSETKSVIRHW